MSAQNTAVARRVIEDHWNRKNNGLATELFTPTCSISTPDGDLEGVEGATMLLNIYSTAFPDFHLGIDDTIAESNKVVVEYTFTGTQKGALGALPPTGRRVSLHGIAIFQIASTKVERAHLVWDRQALMEQLGGFVGA
jgi:steroid delta-isomerase-like uncharacterized protein